MLISFYVDWIGFFRNCNFFPRNWKKLPGKKFCLLNFLPRKFLNHKNEYMAISFSKYPVLYCFTIVRATLAFIFFQISANFLQDLYSLIF